MKKDKSICNFYKLKFTPEKTNKQTNVSTDLFFMVFASWESIYTRNEIKPVRNTRIFLLRNWQITLQYPKVDVNDLESICYLQTTTLVSKLVTG